MSQTPPPGTAGQIVLGAIELSGLLERVENGDATHDEAVRMQDIWCKFKAMVTEYNADVEKALLKAIKKHGGLELGNGRRLYAAANKTTKCIDSKRALVELLELCDGDVERMADVLVSQPFKPSAFRDVMNGWYNSPEIMGKPMDPPTDMTTEFDKFFETVVTSKTKEGASKLKPQIADDSWKGK